MKKIVLLLLLSLLSIGGSSQLKLGVKAGLNNTFPSYKIDSDVLVKPKTSGLGSVLGVFFEVPITETFIFQTELLIDFRYYNAHTTIEESSTNFSSKTEDFGYNKLAYFDFPLFFKYNIRMKTASSYGSDNYFGIYAGPLFGFKILENYKGNRTTTVTSFEQKTVSTNEIKDYNVDFKAFDLSISAGAMLDFEKGLRIGLRYIRSLTAANSNSEFEINYNVLQFSVGYNFMKD